MNPSEAWILLTARSLWQQQRIERGFGAVTPDDVKLALQGLPRRPTLYGFAAFLGDHGSLEELGRIEHLRLIDRANDERWESRRGHETLRRLVALGLYELIAGQRCPDCLGRGNHRAAPAPIARVLLRYRRRIDYRRARASVITEPSRYVAEMERLSQLRRLVNEQLAEADATIGATEPCTSCRGTGKITITETLRSRLSGIPRRTWFRAWDERYAVFYGELQRLDGWAVSHVRGRIKPLVA